MYVAKAQLLETGEVESSHGPGGVAQCVAALIAIIPGIGQLAHSRSVKNKNDCFFQVFPPSSFNIRMKGEKRNCCPLGKGDLNEDF
jgi:hypothetical protein